MRLGYVASAVLAAASLTGPVQADTLIDNVNGLTLAADGTVVRFRRGAGR